MKNTESLLFGCLIGIFLFSIVILWAPNEVTTKKLIKPDVSVTIKNGVADTTYTYKFK